MCVCVCYSLDGLHAFALFISHSCGLKTYYLALPYLGGQKWVGMTNAFLRPHQWDWWHVGSLLPLKRFSWAAVLLFQSVPTLFLFISFSCGMFENEVSSVHFFPGCHWWAAWVHISQFHHFVFSLLEVVFAYLKKAVRWKCFLQISSDVANVLHTWLISCFCFKRKK